MLKNLTIIPKKEINSKNKISEEKEQED